MNIEEKLKELILSRYNSVNEFVKSANIPWATFSSMLKRGINNANLSSIMKICKTLDISADALYKGEIVFNSKETKELENPKSETNEVLEILNETKHRLLHYEGLMFNGQPADQDSINSILNAMEIGIEMVKRKKEYEEKNDETTRENTENSK